MLSVVHRAGAPSEAPPHAEAHVKAFLDDFEAEYLTIDGKTCLKIVVEPIFV